jgi:polysaccharide export outer membrane protein
MPLGGDSRHDLAVRAMGIQPGGDSTQTLHASKNQVISPAAEPPRELAKISLPAYRIEPPDLIEIELVKLVPKPPYRVEVYDVLDVVVVGTLLDAPIDGTFLVAADGTIDLGPPYGPVSVAGRTLPEVTAAVEAHLRLTLKIPEVSVQLLQASGVPPVGGTYMVGPDGTVNLRHYGSVHVAGKTLAEAQRAVESQLARYLDSPAVSVDVAAYNSKAYYIITEGASQGDNVVRVPVTGNETVLDAIAQVQGLSQLSGKEIWIARPAPGGYGCEQHLPVDWDAVTRGASTATNYQVLPGDRIFIAEDGLVATNNFIAKLTAPLERLLGTATLGTSSVRNFQSLGRSFNRSRGGGGF